MIRLLAVALLALLPAPEAPADDALARGEKLLARGDFVRAETALREAVAASPTDPRAHGNLALALLQQSKTREAIDAARLAAAFGPNIPETRFIYGLALKTGGRLLEAAREFERAVALKPDNVPALRASAETYAAAGDERALPAYERLVRLEPGRPEIRIEYAESLWAAGQRDLGDGVAADAAKAFPDSAEIPARYGRALFDRERFLDAARELRRARELGATDASTLSLLGNALWQAGATDDAKGVFGEAVGEHPENAALRQDLGRLLLSRGEAEAAIPHLQEAVRLRPAEGAAALELGRAHEAAGRTADAEAAYRQAIALGPTLSSPHYALGRLLVRAGRAAEGERELGGYRRMYDRTAQRTDESNRAAAQLALGWAELARGDSASALSRFASLPETADALVGRAAALTRQRRHADAARALERARELLPSDLHIQFLLASARAGRDRTVIALLLALAVEPPPCAARLTDVTREAKLDFRHERGATPAHHLPETMGSGIAWLDYDGDGWMDLYVVQSGPFPPRGSVAAQDRLFRNNGDGTFSDVTAKAGLSDAAYGMGAFAADYDNDGAVDLLVTNWGGVILYHNNGDGTFTDVTARAGLKNLTGWFTAAAWADVDGDGRLDLFLGRYVDDSQESTLFCGDVTRGEREYCPPMMYPGTTNVMLHNNGDGTFRDVTREAGLADKVGKALGAVFVDVDLDGRPDLYVANDETINFLFHNVGGGRFEDISVVSGTGFDPEGNPQGGMGVDAGDLDGDGLPDIAVANWETQTNEYYRNLGSGIFEDASVTSGFGPPGWNLVGFGLNFLDLDGDGAQDVFIANGHIYEKPRRQGATYAQKMLLLKNDGRGHFSNRPCGTAFETPSVGRGSAVADYDNDGDPDIAVSSSGESLRLLRNDGTHGNWLGVELVGRKSNRQGIGSRLVAETPDGKKQTRFVAAGGSYLSSSDPRVLFGLGKETSVRRLTIHWPSGTVQVLKDVSAGRYLKVEEK